MSKYQIYFRHQILEFNMNHYILKNFDKKKIKRLRSSLIYHNIVIS